MIQTAVILAAGRGSRLAPKDFAGRGQQAPAKSGNNAHSETYSKPLISVAGTTLLERTIASCRSAGARRIIVVTGFRADRVAERAEAVSQGDVEVVFNADWERANGLSLLACRRFVSGPFALMMSDHLFDPSILSDLMSLELLEGSVTLAVDRKIDSIFDLDDATKVWIEGGRITEISKQLEHYNAVDCGLFACTPAIFEALAAVADRRGDCSLSEGMMALAAERRFLPFDIGGRWWQDVDTPEMLEAALAGLAQVHSSRARLSK